MVSTVALDPSKSAAAGDPRRAAQREHEAAVIAAAHAMIDAGQGLELDALEHWLDATEPKVSESQASISR